jgi:hypothetical protein
MTARGLDHACQTGRRSHAARRFDLYETPPIAVEALIALLSIQGISATESSKFAHQARE